MFPLYFLTISNIFRIFNIWNLEWTCHFPKYIVMAFELFKVWISLLPCLFSLKIELKVSNFMDECLYYIKIIKFLLNLYPCIWLTGHYWDLCLKLEYQFFSNYFDDLIHERSLEACLFEKSRHKYHVRVICNQIYDYLYSFNYMLILSLDKNFSVDKNYWSDIYNIKNHFISRTKKLRFSF